MVVRIGVSDLLALQRRRSRGVFIGEYEKSVAQPEVDRIGRETAASPGPFAKVERLRHRTRNEAGVPWGLSVTGG